MSKKALNPAVGLAHCQNKTALYKAVLQSFYRQHEVWLPCKSLPSAQCQQLAHSIKSTALACGAEALHQQACQLAPPAPAPSNAQCNALLHTLQDVLQAIAAYEPSAAQTSSLHQQLLQALEQHNLSAVSLFKVWSQQDAADWPAATLKQVEAALDAFEFEQALHLIQGAPANKNTHD